MTGLNEDSLRNAIYNLPQHKAGDYVWEEIRWQTGKPLVAELPVHTAPKAAWNGILVSSVSTKPVSVASRAAMISMILLLISSVLFPLFLNQPNTNTKQTALVNGFTPASAVKAKPVTQQNIAVVANSPAKSEGRAESGIFSNGNDVPLAKPSATPATMFVFEEDQTLPLQTLHVKGPGYIIAADKAMQEPIRQRNDKRFDGCSSFHEVNASFFLQADYNPDYFISSVMNSPGNNFSISSGYQHNRLRITLGAGYTRLNSPTQLLYEYRTNELIYSYDYVDSVYVDPISHETFYFTVKVDVYDSIDYTRTEKITDRYSYLQFPLTLSYELAGFNKLSFHLQFSGTYHLLQDNYRNYKPFYEASSRLVSTMLEEKKLSSDYWSAGGGLMLEYRAGSRLGFALTPGIRYSSLRVSGSPSKGLTSYGINFGIYYKIITDR